jgi:hypothetical protein
VCNCPCFCAAEDKTQEGGDREGIMQAGRAYRLRATENILATLLCCNPDATQVLTVGA